MIAELRCAVRWLLPHLHAGHKGIHDLEACKRASCVAGMVARTSWDEGKLRGALISAREQMQHYRMAPEARELVDEALGPCRDWRVVALGVALRKATE